MTTQQWPDKEIPAPGADLATDERTNAAARAIFCVIKPSNMVDTDWDSGAVLGCGDAFRSQCINAARATFAAVPASEPVAVVTGSTVQWLPGAGALKDRTELYAAPAPVSGMPDLAWHDHIIGMEVSMDVSTGDADAMHRIYGTVNEVMLAERGAGTNTILATEEARNFTLPAAPAPTGKAALQALVDQAQELNMGYGEAPTEQADSVDLELAAMSKEIDRQLDGLMDLSESSVDPTTLALAKEVVKVVAERKAAELPALPMCAASYNGGRFYDEGQMGDYARTALARQSSRIRHLERERDMARKDCAALAARQAPDSRDAARHEPWTDEDRERFRASLKLGPRCPVCAVIEGGEHFPGCSRGTA